MQEQLVEELQRQRGIVAAGFTNFLPATGGSLRSTIRMAGVSALEENGLLAVGERTISLGYLHALAVPLLAGSWCPSLSPEPHPPTAALVNRAFVDRYGPDVIGRHFTFDQVAGDNQIVGVIGNMIEDGAGADAAPYVYACQPAGAWPDPEYVVASRADAALATTAIRNIVHRVAPGRALFGLRPLDDVLDASLDHPRWNATAVASFAGAAILLASVGLYSLLVLLVAESSRELGIRMAIGAQRSNIALLVLGTACRVTATGIGAGLALAWAMNRSLAGMLFAVGPLDAATLAATVATFAVVAVAAAAIPIRRALNTNPIACLRAG
jgi:hypothetical protein